MLLYDREREFPFSGFFDKFLALSGIDYIVQDIGSQKNLRADNDEIYVDKCYYMIESGNSRSRVFFDKFLALSGIDYIVQDIDSKLGKMPIDKNIYRDIGENGLRTIVRSP
jgi:hypothetical protein